MEIIKKAETIKLEDFIDFDKPIELPTGDIVKITKDDLYMLDVTTKYYSHVINSFNPLDFIVTYNNYKGRWVTVLYFPEIYIKFRNTTYKLTHKL